MTGQALPPTFTSLYRLFLRLSSASVTHNTRSIRLSRKLWEPSFRAAASVASELQNQPNERRREKLRQWYNVWQDRMDNTLSLLYACASSRGMAHRLHRNILFLAFHHTDWTSWRMYPKFHNRSRWNPHLDPSSELYTPIKMTPKQKATVMHTESERRAWYAVEEAVRLAEARDGLILGRLPSGRQKA